MSEQPTCTCPSVEQLRQFAFADMTGEEFERVAAHQERCEVCQAVIARFDAEEESSDEDAEEGAGWPAVPGYEIEGHLNQGGMGRVLVARDKRIGRAVALKELRRGYERNAELRARFLVEARVTGQLEHPGIVPVYEVIEQAGKPPCYVMRQVRGRTLAETVRDYHARKKDDPVAKRDLLQAFVSVCNTLAYAHARGVVHRDLKGENILLGPYGEVMVIDWGLAKILGTAEPGETPLEPLADGEALVETVVGSAQGTPGFMAPEQANGEVERIDQRTDVFGLGAVLYLILTGHGPYRGRSVTELLDQAKEGKVVSPREVERSVPPGLAAVCLKALSKEPEGRYLGARELGEEVKRWLADEPVKVHPEPWPRKVGRWSRRHPRLATTAALTLVAISLAGVWQYQQISARADRSAEKSGRVSSVLATVRQHYRDRKWLLAREGLRQAEGFAGDPEVSEPVRDEVRALGAAFQAIERLEEVRVQRCGMPNCGFNYNGIGDPAGVFRELGIDPLADAVADSEARVRSYELIRDDLIAALDDWAWVLRTNANPENKSWQRLFAVAHACDDSPMRRDLRAMAQKDLAGSRENLVKMAERPSMESEPITSVLFLHSVLCDAEEFQPALKLLERTLLRAPEHFWVRIKLAEQYSLIPATREYRTALIHWDAARTLRPKNRVTLHNLAATYTHLREFRVAKSILETGFSIAETNRQRAELTHSLGQLAGIQEEWDAARRYAIESHNMDPTYAPPLFNLAMFAVIQKDARMGEDFLTRAVGLAPDDHLVRLTMAKLMVQLGRLDQALHHYSHAIKARPKDVNLRAILQEDVVALGTQLVDKCLDDKRFDTIVMVVSALDRSFPEVSRDWRKGLRYNAACAASNSSSSAKVDSERVRLRSLALAWLTADVASLRASGKEAMQEAKQYLQHAKKDLDLAPIREAIGKLPATERDAWEKYWRDVDELLQSLSPPK